MWKLDFTNLYYNKLSKYQNILVCIFLFFLPFNYALTFQIGFPLKVSELSLIFLSILYFLDIKNKTLHNQIRINKYPFILLILFIAISVISFIINSFWSYDYDLYSANYRFKLYVNSLLKTGYIILIVFSCFVCYIAFSINEKKYLKWWIFGAVMASIYTWYLFIFSLYNLPIIYLPGMDDWPQHGLFSFGHFIRCGTFKEGNYMGLFLLLSGIVGLYCRKYLSALFLFLSIIPTVSSMAAVGFFIFIVSYVTYYWILKKKYSLIIPIYLLIGLFIFNLNKNPDIKFILSKFYPSISNNDNAFKDAQNSKLERLNLISIAFDIGKDNPVWGVGISYYGAHLKHYNKSKIYNTGNFYYIPNNIYMELFSELGIISIILFLSFLGFIIRKTLLNKNPLLFSGVILLIFYFFAFPTFSVLFIWAFFGLVLKTDNPSSFGTLKSDKIFNEYPQSVTNAD